MTLFSRSSFQNLPSNCVHHSAASCVTRKQRYGRLLNQRCILQLTPAPRRRSSLRLPTTEPLYHPAKSFLGLALDARVSGKPLSLPTHLRILEHLSRALAQLGEAAPLVPVLAFLSPKQGLFLLSLLCFSVRQREGAIRYSQPSNQP